MKHQRTKFPNVLYVFTEKVGPFMETAQKAWEEAHRDLPKENKTGAMALYRFKPEMTYRAGFIYSEKPSRIPKGFRYEKFDGGGDFECFEVVGSYDQLPRASGDVWAAAQTLSLRDGWAIENYLNDPDTTPEAHLVTHILVPVK